MLGTDLDGFWAYSDEEARAVDDLGFLEQGHVFSFFQMLNLVVVRCEEISTQGALLVYNARCANSSGGLLVLHVRNLHTIFLASLLQLFRVFIFPNATHIGSRIAG